MQFFLGHPYDGTIHTADDGRTFSPITGAPVWFARNSLHVAIFVMEGPAPAGPDSVALEADEVLVRFEVPQPPAGTIQARVRPYPQTFAKFKRNTEMLGPNTLLGLAVDPTRIPKPGDRVAIWFSAMAPAMMIGVCKTPPETSRKFDGKLTKDLWD